MDHPRICQESEPIRTCGLGFLFVGPLTGKDWRQGNECVAVKIPPNAGLNAFGNVRCMAPAGPGVVFGSDCRGRI